MEWYYANELQTIVTNGQEFIPLGQLTERSRWIDQQIKEGLVIGPYTGPVMPKPK